MEGRPHQRFPKSARLRKRAEYLKVQEHGIKVQTKAFIGLVVPRPGTATRIGITTSKRLGKAVARNRTRRLVREAFRTGKLNLPNGLEIVVIARSASSFLTSEELFAELELLGRRVRKLKEISS
ncbi:MAG: ribonuclease P protein component [Myxococcota bacterium]|jgi:ribonuclease P protein component|nr:ribonuclease P protein component [Myxococcota bacterium]